MADPIFSSNRTMQNTNSTVKEDFTFDVTKLPFYALYFDITDVIMFFYIPILIFGITSNILNIVVFAKTGAKDNVTVSFLALSMSDLTYLVVIFPFFTVMATVHYLVQKLDIRINWLLDIRVITHPSYWYSYMFYETSILITVYISVVRCACVAMPFSVKSTFTSRRAVITFIIFLTSIFLLRIPMFMTKRVIFVFDPMSNTTRVAYREFDDGGLAERIQDIVNRNILNWTSIIIVIACLVVMVTKLRASVRFRSSIGATHSAATDKGTSDDGLNDAQAIPSEQNPASQTKPIKDKKMLSSVKGKQQMLSSREAQVVRSVILVAAVFVTCQAPLMAYTLARRFESQFDDGDKQDGEFIKMPKYLYLFALFSNISSLFTLINASVNIIIHYNFNSRYRQSMKTLWKFN